MSNAPKILYLSCHEILEYDELRMFRDIGIEVFSLGAYIRPDRPGRLRPPLGISNFSNVNELYDIHHLMYLENIKDSNNKYPDKKLTKEFVDRFDIIIIMHIPEFIHMNWDVIKHKVVIWRTIGQSIASVEQEISKYRQEGLKIVRYSPKEQLIPSFCGEDALIRFGKYKSDFDLWSGSENAVITLGQSMKARDSACNYSLFERVTRDLNRKLFGSENSNTFDLPCIFIPEYSSMMRELGKHRVYFYTGTLPASYTLNFIEAFIVGIPIVAIGKSYNKFGNINLYEVDELIGNCGFVCELEDEMRSCIKDIMNDFGLAKELSVKARSRAIELFDSGLIKQQWKEFLFSI